MGEAKRKANVQEFKRLPLPEGDGLSAIVMFVLTNTANILNARVCLKEPDDGLLDTWPISAIIGQTHDLSEVRAAPVEFETKLRPDDVWEFLIPDKFLVAVYCAEALNRKLAWPGPVHPDEFMSHVREFFRTYNAPGWITVAPIAWEQAITEPGRRH